MEENSITGCHIWSWLKHRLEELIRPSTVLDDTGNMTHCKNNHGRSDLVYNLPWEGIPVICSSGDSAQLPPVMVKTFYDSTVERVDGSNHVWKIGFANYINSIDKDINRSTLIVMYENTR